MDIEMKDLTNDNKTNSHQMVMFSASKTSREVTVKELAALHRLNIGVIYHFIKTEPDFPVVNKGIKKKLMIDNDKFEIWLSERTKKQKHEHFGVPTSIDLIGVFKSKNVGVLK